MLHFKLKRSRSSRRVKWLNRNMVYEGKMVSATGQVVRLFAPDPWDDEPYLDLPYEWLIPVEASGTLDHLTPGS